jgi:hypothetical protein
LVAQNVSVLAELSAARRNTDIARPTSNEHARRLVTSDYVPPSFANRPVYSWRDVERINNWYNERNI